MFVSQEKFRRQVSQESVARKVQTRSAASWQAVEPSSAQMSSFKIRFPGFFEPPMSRNMTVEWDQESSKISGKVGP